MSWHEHFDILWLWCLALRQCDNSIVWFWWEKSWWGKKEGCRKIKKLLSNLPHLVDSILCDKKNNNFSCPTKINDRRLTHEEFDACAFIFQLLLIQSISVIRPAFLEGENGPYKQIGPVSSTNIQCLEIEKLTWYCLNIKFRPCNRFKVKLTVRYCTYLSAYL